MGISFEIYTCGHATFVQSWAFRHLDDVFFFQEIGKVNGIQVPFTIGIRTPIQCHQCFHVATKVLFQWMPNFTQMT